MDEMSIVYMAVTSVVLLIALAMAPYAAPGLLFYIILFFIVIALVIIAILNWADFLIFPFVMGRLGIIFEPVKGYTISKNQEAVIKHVGELYYATGYITANLYPYEFKQEFSDQEVQQKIVNAPDVWERAVSSIDFPFKFHVLSTGRDVQKARDELEGKRSYQEFQMSRMMQNSKGNEMGIVDVQRKINILQAKMDRLSHGEKPISTIMYIETASVGVTEKSALDNLSAQIERLQVAMSSMDIQLIRVVGRELYTLFNFTFSLPTSYMQAASYFDLQG